jgi:hypothetical protein
MILEEIVLTERVLEGVLVEGAPFSVAAMGDPVGDVAFGDDEAELFDGLGDFLVGNSSADEATDQIASVLGQGSDGAGPWAATKQACFGGRRGDGNRGSVDDGGHVGARRRAANESLVLGFLDLREGGDEGFEGVSWSIHMRFIKCGWRRRLPRAASVYIRKVKTAKIPGSVKISFGYVGME